MLKNPRLVLPALLISLVPSLGTSQVPLKESAKAATSNPRKLYSPNSLSGPILGLVFDTIRGGLRPIWGTPGASTLGDILDTGISMSRAWISPGQNYVLAQVEESGEVALLDLSRDLLALSSLGIAKSGPDQIAFSPTGASVVLHHRASRSVQLITGLPSAPALVAEIDISGLPESLSALAVSDDGGAALLGVFEGESGSVYALTQQAEASLVSVVGQAAAISFLNHSRDALIADRRNHEIVLLRDVTGMAQRLTLAGESDGILGPVAVQVADDNRRILIANSGSSSVSVLHLDTGSIKQVPCGTAPSGLYRMGSPSVFRLTDYSEEPLLLLDAGTEEPRSIFVPRLPAE